MLASALCAGCVTRPVSVTTTLIDCRRLIPSTLRAGEEASRVVEPDGTAGGWVNFAQLTEAVRIGQARDRQTVVQISDQCAEENERINRPAVRRRVLGLF